MIANLRVTKLIIVYLLGIVIVAAQNCTLCSEGRSPVDPNREVRKSSTCSEIGAIVDDFSLEECVKNSNQIIVYGTRCGCRDYDEFPACTVQQNPSYCTTGLLESATEECECYSFCGKNFAGCTTYPGARASCEREYPVSGCNYASALDGPNPFFRCSGVCPGGVQNFLYPDKIIPKFSLIPNFFIPTCQQIDTYLKNSPGIDCQIVQALGGYCGCGGIEPVNACSLCPEGEMLSNPMLVTELNESK